MRVERANTAECREALLEGGAVVSYVYDIATDLYHWGYRVLDGDTLHVADCHMPTPPEEDIPGLDAFMDAAEEGWNA